MQGPKKCAFSVDVEDWFHILDVAEAPDITSWPRLPSRVEGNFRRLLDLFSEEGSQVTCFFLGWIAERFPHLVREAVACGHEIASHGYSHQLVYKMTQTQFRADALRARLLLEDISGTRVIGYRAPGFSSTAVTPWFFDEVYSSGYLYDSSVFPARRGHGGSPDSPTRPHFVVVGRLVEFPVSVAEIGPLRICFFGGGYLRLFHYSIIRRMGKRQIANGAPLSFYIHPREIDINHPRIPMSLRRRFKSYINLRPTEMKIRQILREFAVTTCSDYLFGSESELAGKEVVSCKIPASAEAANSASPRAS
jgi:polysaccharide deacetylase family protein (PEP-CTERM system associated)